MALEHLRSIFSEEDPTAGGDRGDSWGGTAGGAPPKEQSPPLTPIEELYKPFSKVAEKINFGPPVTTDYSVSKKYKNFYTGGTILTGKLATGEYSGADTYDDMSQENVKLRDYDITNLGAGLGEGKFVLETLYNKDHTPKLPSERIQIQYGQTTINTWRPGMGTLENLIIKNYSSDKITYRGSPRDGVSDDLKEPFFINSIGTDQDPEDMKSRILKWANSPDGTIKLGWEYTQNIFWNVVNTKNWLNKVIKPVIPILKGLPEAGAFLGMNFGQNDLVSYLSGTEEGGLVAGLTNIRKRLHIDYSKRSSYGLGFGQLGDGFSKNPLAGTPVNIVTQFANDYGLRNVKNIEFENHNKSTTKLNFAKGAKSLVDAVGSLVPKWEIIPRKTNPFFDLSGGPSTSEFSKALGIGSDGRHNSTFGDLGLGLRAHGYTDRIADSTQEEDVVLGWDVSLKKLKKAPPLETTSLRGPKRISPGDFYVRIKDLRDNMYIYFRGYVTGITENVSPAWTPTNYVGRSEPVYMYERAERDISFNLRVYPANNKQFNAMYQKMERLTSLAYPAYMEDNQFSGVQRMKPPFTELYMAHIGNKSKGQFGFIKSIAYTVNETGDWDANQALPKLFDVAISYQILSKRPPGLGIGNGSHERGFYGVWKKEGFTASE